MSISSALNAGVAGLAVNSIRLAAISDNIANSETFGFKRVDTEFSDLVLQQQSGGAFTAGGVRATTFRDVGAQGSLITTNNATDIAVNGRGLLPVTDFSGVGTASSDRPLLLTTTGSFSPDQSGFLRTSSGLFLLGFPTDVNGDVGSPVRDSAASLEPVRLNINQFAAEATTEIQIGLNLPAAETQAGAAGTSFNLPVEYFDTLGRSQSLDIAFTPVVPANGASNEWQITVTDLAGDPTTPIAEFSVTFDDSLSGGGNLASVTPGAGATFDPETGAITVNASSNPIDLIIGSPGRSSPITQFSASFTPTAISSNGAPLGNLASVEIDDQGFVQAIFDSGFRRTIYQVPVADVPNINGLTAVGNQAFRISQTSGDFFLFDSGDGPVGSVVGFALAESTTDIAGELTDLIQTQRAYSSNARVIQTIDEILQETTNII